METVLYLLGISALYGVNYLVGKALGWATTEFRGPLIDVKPFNCRGCMTFWLTFIPGTVLAFFVTEGVGVYLLSMVAALSAYINYLYIKFKSKVYE